MVQIRWSKRLTRVLQAAFGLFWLFVGDLGNFDFLASPWLGDHWLSRTMNWVMHHLPIVQPIVTVFVVAAVLWLENKNRKIAIEEAFAAKEREILDKIQELWGHVSQSHGNYVEDWKVLREAIDQQKAVSDESLKVAQQASMKWNEYRDLKPITDHLNAFGPHAVQPLLDMMNNSTPMGKFDLRLSKVEDQLSRLPQDIEPEKQR